MALYNTVIVFDQATKLAYVITWVHLDRHSSLEEAYQHGQRQLQITSRKIENEHSPNLTNGKVSAQVISCEDKHRIVYIILVLATCTLDQAACDSFAPWLKATSVIQQPQASLSTCLPDLVVLSTIIHTRPPALKACVVFPENCLSFCDIDSQCKVAVSAISTAARHCAEASA